MMAVLPILAEVVTAEIPVNRYSAPGVRVEGVTGSYQLEDQHTAAVLCHHTKQIIGSSMATEYPPLVKCHQGLPMPPHCSVFSCSPGSTLT